MAVLQPHDRLGGYSIIRFVRTGSTGSLYIARRVGAPGFAPNVAIKVIAPSLIDTKATSDRFDEEIIRASKIDDPRIVRMDELGDDHGVRYIAMELVRGFSLSDMLAFYYERERRIRPALAVYIAMQGALALQAAHETRDPQGNHLRLIHGALSTKRMLVSWKGHVKVIRFGFAKVMADEPLTSWQRLFRAPDASEGEKIDGRHDVFALGAILLASLARGGLPVLDGNVDLSAIHGALARAEGIPARVGDVLVQSLQARREDRPTPLAIYRALVDAMPEALKITPSDVARELAAIRLDREFQSFAQDRSLVGSSYIPPKMTEVPSPFTTAHPRTSEASSASERIVVPPLPALPLLATMAERSTPVIVEPTPPPPPTSSSSPFTSARVEYPAAAQAVATEMTATESQPQREARKASERPPAEVSDGDQPTSRPSEKPTKPPERPSATPLDAGAPPNAKAVASPAAFAATVMGPMGDAAAAVAAASQPPIPPTSVPVPSVPSAASSQPVLPIEEVRAPRSKAPMSIIAVAVAFAAGLLVAAAVSALRGEGKPAVQPAASVGGHPGAAFDYSPPLAPVPLSTAVRTTRGEVKSPVDAAPPASASANVADAAPKADARAPSNDDTADMELHAIATVAAASGSDEPFDQAGTRVLAGDVSGARAVLESRLAAGRPNADEVHLLRAICKQQRDAACLERLRRLEGGAPRK